MATDKVTGGRIMTTRGSHCHADAT